VKPVYLFCCFALAFALPGYVFLFIGAKPWLYGTCGIHGALMGIIALAFVAKEAGWFGKGGVTLPE